MLKIWRKALSILLIILIIWLEKTLWLLKSTLTCFSWRKLLITLVGLILRILRNFLTKLVLLLILEILTSKILWFLLSFLAKKTCRLLLSILTNKTLWFLLCILASQSFWLLWIKFLLSLLKFLWLKTKFIILLTLRGTLNLWRISRKKTLTAKRIIISLWWLILTKAWVLTCLRLPKSLTLMILHKTSCILLILLSESCLLKH